MKLRKFVYVYAQMVRIQTSLLLIIFSFIGYTAGSGSLSPSFSYIAVVMCIINWFVFSSCVNDLADEKIDKINLAKQNQERPLVMRSGTRKQLVIIMVLALSISTASSLLISYAATIITLLACAYSAVYSLPPIRISYRGLWAPLTLPLVYVLYTFFVGFYYSGVDYSGSLNYLLLGMYFCFFARIILKDYRDVVGDKKYKKLTFLVLHGPKATAYVSIAGWAAGVLLLTLFLNESYQIFLVILSVLLISITTYKLSAEQALKKQLILIAIIGRLANVVVWTLWLSLSTETRYENLIPIITVGVALMYYFLAYDAVAYLKPAKAISVR